MKLQESAAKSSAVVVPSLPTVITHDAMLARFSPKDRDGFERQINACITKGGEPLAAMWREFAALFLTLATRPPKLTGVNTMQFFIPDGKHRKQVFAMHCTDEGLLNLYLPNVLDDAIKAGIVAKVGKTAEEISYVLPATKEKIGIEPLDRDTLNPQFYYKDMTGWNRKAICVSLSATASADQKHAVEKLVALAARGWPADAV